MRYLKPGAWGFWSLGCLVCFCFLEWWDGFAKWFLFASYSISATESFIAGFSSMSITGLFV